MRKSLLLFLLVMSSSFAYQTYGQGWAIEFYVDMSGADCYFEDLNSLSCNGFTGTTEGYSQPSNGRVTVTGTTYSSNYSFSFSGSGTMLCPPPGSNTTINVNPSRTVTYDITNMGCWVPYTFPTPSITTGQVSFNVTALFHPRLTITETIGCKIKLSAGCLGVTGAPSITWQVDDSPAFDNPVNLTTLTGQSTIELTSDELQALTNFPGSPYNVTRYFRAMGKTGTQSLSEPVTTPYPPIELDVDLSDGINPSCPEGEGKIKIVQKAYTAGTVDLIDYTIATFFEKPAGVTSCSITQPTDVPVSSAIPSGYCYDDFANYTVTSPNTSAVSTLTLDSAMISPAINMEEGIVLVYAEAKVNGAYTCAVSDTFLINDPAAVVISGGASPGDRPSCIGGNDGSVSITLTGGQAPYSYTLKRISPDSTITLNQSTTSKTITTSRSIAYSTTDNYKISIKDNCQDTDYLDFKLTQDGANNLSLQTVAASSDLVVDCYNDATQKGDGFWTVNVSGNYPTSTTGYIYSLYENSSPKVFVSSQTVNSRTALFSNLGKANYIVRVKAPNNCVNTTPVTLTLPNPLDGTFGVTHSCRNENNGRLRFNRSAGTTGSMYLELSTGENNTSTTDLVSIGSLSPATRTVTAKDLCLDPNEASITNFKQTSIAVNHLDTLSFSSATTIPDGIITLSCSDDTYSGTIGYQNGRGPTYTVTVTKNGSAYSVYTHSTSLQTVTLNNMLAGTYVVTISGTCTTKNTITRTFTIVAPSPIIATISKTDLTCYQNNSGKITLAVSGGVPGTNNDGIKNYQFRIYDDVTDLELTPATTNCSPGSENCVVYTGLNATTQYRMTATDFNTDGEEGVCLVDFTAQVQDLGEPGRLQVNPITATQLSNEVVFSGDYYVRCKSDTNIALTASATGGTPPYKWYLKNSTETIVQNNSLFDTLGADSYTVYVGDQNHCDSSMTQNLVINEATFMLLVDRIYSPTFAHGANTSCYDSLDAAIHVEVSGGVGQYTYTLMSELDTTAISKTPPFNIFSGLPAINSAGDHLTYKVLLSDELGCTWESQNGLSNTIALEPPDTVEFYWNVVSRTVAGHEIPCQGDEATVSFTSEGGKFPHTITINGEALPIDSLGSAEFDLLAGSYSPIIVDDLGCPGLLLPFDLIEPVSHVTITPGSIAYPVCIGGEDGEINVSASGGVTFTDPGEEYFFLIRKELASTFDTDTLRGTAATFFREANRYLEQKYIVQVRDGHDCSDEVEMTMPRNPSPLTLVDEVRISPSCNGATDGSIQLKASNYDLIGGTSLIFKLSGGHLKDSVAEVIVTGDTYTFTNLQGTDLSDYTPYQAWVEDANACTDSADQFLDNLTLISYPPVEIDLLETIRPSCYNGSDGSLNVQLSGGVQPYQYSTDSVNFQPANPDHTIFLDNLVGADYKIYVRDANFKADQPSCLDTATFEVVDGRIIELRADIESISCKGGNDGIVDLTIDILNRPITEDIDTLELSQYWTHDEISSLPIDTLSDIDSLTAGTYTVHVTYDLDTIACINEKSFIVREPVSPFAIENLKVYDTSCGVFSDGMAIVSVSGGWTDSLTYYRVDAGPWQLFTGSGFLVSNLSAALHTIDISQCSFTCLDTETFEIKAASLEIAVANIISPVCPMGSDGIVVLSSGALNVEYAFEGSASFQSLGVFGDLSSGNYRFIGRLSNDHNCLSEVVEATITDPADCGGGPLALVLLGTVNATCAEATNGQAQLRASGGTPPYQYYWDAESSPSGDTRSGLSSGVHSVKVVDEIGGEQTISITLGNNPDLDVQYFTTLASCETTCDGSVDLLVTGGSDTYEIQWNDGNLEISRDSLCIGDYTYVVTDASSDACTTSAIVTIGHFPNLEVTLQEVVAPICPQGTDGHLTVSISGGSGDFALSWSNGVVNTTRLENAMPSDYVLTILDNTLGCTLQDTFSLPDAVAITVSAVNTTAPLCYLGADGTAELTLANVKSPLVKWDNSQIGLRATGLQTGTIGYTIKGSTGCVISGVVEVPNRPELITDVSYSNTTCFGSCDGAIELTPSGGASPYYISWSNGLRTSAIDQLCKGSFTYSIADKNKCRITGSVDITSPEMIQIQSTKTDPSCYNFSDGEISVVSSGGTGNHNFTWSNGATTSSITGLDDDDYTITVTDENNCAASQVIALTHPAPLLITNLSVINPSCPSTEDGSINFDIQGGTADYSFVWNDNITTQQRTQLPSGDFDVTVTDSHGCVLSKEFSLSLPGMLEIVNVAMIEPTCNGDENGSVSLEVVGGAKPYTYVWNNQSTIEDIELLAAGVYEINVNDSKGCSLSSTFTLNDPPVPLILGIPETILICTHSQAVAQPEGTWSTYEWSGPDGFLITSQRFESSVGGTYTLNVTDNNGCPADLSFTVEVSPNALTSDFLRISEAVAFEPIIFVDISTPTPQTIEWIVPENPDVVLNSNANGILELVFLAPGSYEIGMKAKMDMCSSELYKIVEVLEPEGGRKPDEEFTSHVEEKLEVSIYPNPAGDHLEILLEAESKDPIHVRLIRVMENRSVMEENLSGYKDYLLRWDIPHAPSGIYYLVYEQNKKIRSKKIVVIK
jgi:hypothetical protein